MCFVLFKAANQHKVLMLSGVQGLDLNTNCDQDQEKHHVYLATNQPIATWNASKINYNRKSTVSKCYRSACKVSFKVLTAHQHTFVSYPASGSQTAGVKLSVTSSYETNCKRVWIYLPRQVKSKWGQCPERKLTFPQPQTHTRVPTSCLHTCTGSSWLHDFTAPPNVGGAAMHAKQCSGTSIRCMRASQQNKTQQTNKTKNAGAHEGCCITRWLSTSHLEDENGNSS